MWVVAVRMGNYEVDDGRRVVIMASRPSSQRARVDGVQRLDISRRVVEGPLTEFGGWRIATNGILAAVKKLGYRFASTHPANSRGTLLYGKKPKFQSRDGRFSLA